MVHFDASHRAHTVLESPSHEEELSNCAGVVSKFLSIEISVIVKSSHTLGSRRADAPRTRQILETLDTEAVALFN